MLPWSRRMFPGTNLQDLNLDWILRKISALRGGSTGQYLYKKSDNDFDFGWKTGGGGGGGTSDYLDLENKPSINNVELTGNKTAADLGLAAASDIPAVPVQSVNGQTGDVNLSAADVGAGTYSKPSGGIPKSDLASSVRASLDKADSALQAVPSTYRTAAAQDVIDAAQDADIKNRAQAGEIGIVITGARPSMAVTAGQYVIVRNSTISGISDGLYIANAALSPSTDVTAANLTSVSEGGLNSLIEVYETQPTVGDNVTNVGTFVKRSGKVAVFSGIARATANLAGTGATIFTIPSEYAPNTGVTASCYATYNGNPGMYNFFLQPDGVFRTNVGAGIINADTAVYINFTYFTK